MTRLAHAAALVGVLLLGGCVVQPVRPLPPLPPAELAIAEARQVAHEAWTRQHGQWSLAGRVAVSSGRDGGNGRIEWSQAGDAYDVRLSAPVTRQSWRLAGDGRLASLEGLEGGTRRGEDPARLLREATRWEIPVAALASWVRGARADPAQHGPATVAYGEDRRLSRLQQDGWTILYGGWTDLGGHEVPARLDASRADSRVRLIIDSWDTAGAP